MKDITGTVKRCLHGDCCYVTKLVAIMSTLSCTVGYCLYGTLLLRLHSASSVQIRAHHHIVVYTDINQLNRRKGLPSNFMPTLRHFWNRQ